MFRRAPQKWVETSRIRPWIAVFCVLFLTLSGFVHVTGHALQPVAGAGTEISMKADSASYDGQTQFDIESFHCHGCAVASVPGAPEADIRTTIGETIVSQPLYQAVQQRLHADPPPPRILT